MMTSATTVPQLAEAAKRLWSCVGTICSDAEVRNWGVPGCDRWVVVITYWRESESLYWDECDTQRKADQLAARINRAFDAA